MRFAAVGMRDSVDATVDVVLLPVIVPVKQVEESESGGEEEPTQLVDSPDVGLASGRRGHASSSSCATRLLKLGDGQPTG